VEVGQHFYWQIGGFQVHAQVFITSWIVIAISKKQTGSVETFYENKFKYRIYPIHT
jgi:hypothetical protein